MTLEDDIDYLVGLIIMRVDDIKEKENVLVIIFRLKCALEEVIDAIR